jgi:magnesium chelatase family protein
MTLDYPASFMLVAAMNPCPCGFYNHPRLACQCVAGEVKKYLNRISGPLFDRIDIHIEVVPVDFQKLSDGRPTERSEVIRARVIAARKIQEKRFEDQQAVYCNAQLPSRMLRQLCHVTEAGNQMLRNAMDKLGLSARAYDRILKVARTIADLEQSDDIRLEHLAEAINYRSLDRENWGS